VAATALAVLNTVREAPPAVTPASVVRAVTTLSFDDGTPAYLATLDTASGAILLVPVPSAPDAEGRVPELWLIPAGESPRSLGVVTTDKAHTIAVPAELRRAMTAGSTLAISLEPVGGAPQGVPTGPIVAKGNIAST
jgi:anti-sigma-K factor RskA